MSATNAAALSEPDLNWAPRAAAYLRDVGAALSHLPGAEDAAFDHIGSTSVPGLAAKPIIDLQVRILPLPSHEDLVPCLEPLGYKQALGSRPDSPGGGATFRTAMKT
jgi:GrpB-like predicted nucleotidyltransferase (UPF0157 family)